MGRTSKRWLENFHDDGDDDDYDYYYLSIQLDKFNR